MKRIINFSKTIYELSKDNPEIVGIMKDLGFENIASPGMLNTAGRFMTIPKGAEMKKIDLNKIREVFKNRGYHITE